MLRNNSIIHTHGYSSKYYFIPIFSLLLYLIAWSTTYADSGVDYMVSIEGVENEELKNTLEKASNTVTLQKQPPASISLLKKRVDKDIERLQTVLRSRGFYAAQIDQRFDSDARPVQVHIKITPGNPYLLKKIEVSLSGEGALLKDSLPVSEVSGLDLNTPALSEKILNARTRLKKWMRSRGYPFSETEYPEVIVDHAKQSVSVRYDISSGPSALFGATIINGLEYVDESFVREKIPWVEGDSFNADLVEKAKSIFIETGLFTTIDVEIGESPDQNLRVPVIIHFQERYRRTLKTGINYMTDEGAAGKISWENRNLFGHGESLNLSAVISEISYAAEGKFNRPEFIRPDQDLILGSRFAQDTPEAYTSLNFSNQAMVERTFPNNIKVRAGLGLILSEIKEQGKEDRFNLLNIPLTMDRDGSDDLLDPSRGGRLNIEITPYHDLSSSDLTFIKGRVRYSHYFPISTKERFILALKASLGVIEGAESYDIPADIRFYTGGGGTVRGYAYQSIGPYQEGIPAGGRSLLGFSSEVRIKWTDRIGWVFFLDGGNVFEDSYPDHVDKIRWGSGVGFRYYTAIGPLRLDIGIPLDPVKERDDSFQIYLSLGQAF